METYFQNPEKGYSLETTSCRGCHYGDSDMDFSWALKNRTFPQLFNQGRFHPEDSKMASELFNVKKKKTKAKEIELFNI